MSATGAGYDLSCTTYSPDGRVFQVEYAVKAVEKSGTVIGICCRDGCVLGVEKIMQSRMLLDKSNRRIHTVDYHVGMALAGFAADARQLANRARSEAASYKGFYGHDIPGKVLNERIAAYMHTYTLYWHVRPFGCSVIMASYDKEEGPALYMTEPSGISYKYHACALGKHKQSAKTDLEKIDFSEMTCAEAVKKVAQIIYKLHDDVKDKNFVLELSWVCDASDKKHVMVPQDVYDEAVRLAKEARDADDESEDEI